ncbi:MAG: bacterial Ig-like domain-containing protein [Clostridia bacterium]|nr:bacterial Ig-like domain-containing protein [Clostridia bacterium]
MKRQHKNLRTFLCILLVIFMMYSGMSIGVVAYASAGKIYYVPDTYYSASPDDISTAATDIPLEEYLVSELIKCPEVIDISSYYITPDKINDLSSLIYDNSPELFHVSSLKYFTLFGYILSITPEYRYTADEYTVMYNDCLKSADKILSGIKDNNDLSDVEKALLIHDRIAVLCEYDYDDYQLDTIPHESYSMYGVLVNGVAVCQGYAEAYFYLLREVGIDSYLCESSALNHAWNIVEIDGEEYHVDITWDDPVNDITGRVKHTNFLRSSAGIYETNHTADDYITTPDSTIYDDYFWQNSTTAFQLLGDEIYYIDEKDSYIKKYSDNSSVKSVSDRWQTSSDCYARLSSDGTNLFYNSSQSVFEFNPETGETTEIWTPDTENEYFRIYGFKYQDNYLFCDLYSSPYFTLTTKADYQQKKLYPSVPIVLTGISINTYPDKTEYDIGDVYSSEGLSLLLSYSDGTSSVITDGFIVSGGDTSSEGEKTVTVTHEDFSATYTINVACTHKTVSNVSAAASTCKSQGHEAYSKCLICSKILSGSDELLPLADHSHVPTITTDATCTTDGKKTFTCSVCSNSYTEAIIANGHSHTAVVTAPTCTEKGYTTYTCECGDSYVADFVDTKGHSHTAEITTPATHLTEGVMTYTCTCGDSYTEAIEKLTKHTYKTVITAPTCEEQGFTTYTCECGDSYVADFVDVTAHKDKNNDEYCDYCDEFLGVEEDENSCSHICHKSGFIGFIWKIVQFFWKLFSMNPICECGAAHY